MSRMAAAPPPATRTALSPLALNAPATAPRTNNRKSSTSNGSTPVAPDARTPLGMASLDRLAPLAAPRFIARTPPSRADADAFLRTQTSMTRLRLADLDDGVDAETDTDEDAVTALARQRRGAPERVRAPRLGRLPLRARVGATSVPGRPGGGRREAAGARWRGNRAREQHVRMLDTPAEPPLLRSPGRCTLRGGSPVRSALLAFVPPPPLHHTPML
jgi:hypothetical protein